MSVNICYRKLRHYKYQVVDEDYSVAVDLKLPGDIRIENFIELTAGGQLTISRGYAWDGPSGPTFDTRNFMRGSLVHDAFYQLLREGKFSGRDPEYYRRFADNLLKQMCLEDGMSKIRAWYVHKAVSWFGGGSAKHTDKYQKRYFAPHDPQ